MTNKTKKRKIEFVHIDIFRLNNDDKKKNAL